MMKYIKLIQRFARLDHFKPFYIVMMPAIFCAWTFGYHGTIVPALVKTAFSVFLLMTGGCIYNDWIDLDYDRKIERSKNRPMASGELNKLYALFCIPLFIAFIYSAFLFRENVNCFFYVALGLTLIYPFAKRFTNYPQFVLGAVNFTSLIVYVETTYNSFSILPAISFYVMSVLWIVLYDTLYAWSDIKDDKNLGLGNIGIVIGPKYMPVFIELSWLAMWICWAIHLNYWDWMFWITFLAFIVKGFSQKSRFIKNSL